MQNEICENCGAAIGRLEKAFVYKGHIVCNECDNKLRKAEQEVPSACVAATQTVPIAGPTGEFARKIQITQEIIYCPKCGTKNDANAFRCIRCREVIQIMASPQGVQILDNDPVIRMMLPVGRSALAIVAGYAGLFAFLIFPAPVALILAFLAIHDIKKHPDKHGMGRAVFALLAGILGTALLLLIIVRALV